MPIEFKILKGASGYLTGRLSVGAFLAGKSVVLFDSGLDKSTATAIDKALNTQGLKVNAIINTHSHADHCGGNAYFQMKNPELKIYCSDWEKPFIEMPHLEPTCFCASAEPFAALNNKHLKAEPSIVTNLITPYEDQYINILDKIFRILTLPGHTPGMIGIISPDNILYCGDAFFGQDTLSKHAVLFYTNIAETIKSLNKIIALEIDGAILYHGGPIVSPQEIKSLLENHIEIINNTANFILAEINKHDFRSIDELTQRVMQNYKIPDNVVQFTLTRTCVNAYITYLEQNKLVELSVKSGLLGITSTTNRCDISSSKRRYGLSVLAGYSVLQSNANLALSIHFTPSQTLTGDPHIDASILTGVELLVDILKNNGVVSNKETNVQYGSNIVKLNYKENDLGPISANRYPVDEISVVHLNENKCEIMINCKNPQALHGTIKGCLQQIGLPVIDPSELRHLQLKT